MTNIIMINCKEDDEKHIYALIHHEVAHIKKRHHIIRSLAIMLRNMLIFSLLLTVMQPYVALVVMVIYEFCTSFYNVIRNRIVKRQELSADYWAVGRECGSYSLIQAITAARLHANINGYPSIQERINNIVQAQLKKGEKEFNEMNLISSAVEDSIKTEGAI